MSESGLLTFLIYFLCTEVSAEVITLTRNNNITCVVTRETSSEMYATNSTSNITFYPHDIKFDDWHESDWLRRISTSDYGLEQPKNNTEAIPCENENCVFNNYNFTYSHNISLKKSFIDIKTFDCIVTHVVVAPNCFLNITVESEGGIINHQTVNSTYHSSGYKIWKPIRIEISDVKSKRLYFERGRYDREMEGFWAVDNIRECQKKGIYSKIIETGDTSKYVCKTNSFFEEGLQFNCQPSYLGEYCNITCSSILGPEFPNCENHRVCLENDCHCAWGYEGPNCDTTCKKGFFGLDCMQRCGEKCKDCDSIYGCTWMVEESDYSGDTTNEKESLFLENCSAYGRNNDMISVKCKISKSLFNKSEEYEIRTLDKNHSKLLNFTNMQPCKLWINSLCSKTRVLQYEEVFNITIQIKNNKTSNWSKEQMFTITATNESSAPENLQINLSPNSSYFDLFWENPLYINNNADKFIVEINGSVIKNQTLLEVKEYQQNYTFQIPVSSCRNCTITVFVQNGQKASTHAYTSKPILELSHTVAILWCSKSCSLLLPSVDSNVRVYVADNITKNVEKLDCALDWQQGVKCDLGDFSKTVLSRHQFIKIEHKKQSFLLDFSEVEDRTKLFLVISIIAILVAICIKVLKWCRKHLENYSLWPNSFKMFQRKPTKETLFLSDTPYDESYDI